MRTPLLASVVIALGILTMAGCSASTDSVDEDAQDVTSAIVTCTPVGIAPAWFWGDHSISWDKAWFRKNKSGELALTFHVSRDGAAPKNEVWEQYQDSPVNESKKTSSKVHVVLGEDVTYTLDATRTSASTPYTGTLTTSEEDTFQVSCQ